MGLGVWGLGGWRVGRLIESQLKFIMRVSLKEQPQARRARESSSVSNFRKTMVGIKSMGEMHTWLFSQHLAYSSARLLHDREPVDPAVLASY